MAFTKDKFALAWFAIPSEQDWTNLIASNVKRILLGYQVAKTQPNVLARLAGINRHVVVRLEQDLTEDAPTITRQLQAISHIVRVDAVILGCEPDSGLDWTYTSPDWGHDFMYVHSKRIDILRGAVRGAGLSPISPALSMPPDAISEGGHLMPGRYQFAEIVRESYDMCDGGAAHLYAMGWGSIDDVNELRFKFGLKQVCETWHKPIWIDEVGVILGGNNVAQMSAYCRMADIIMKHPAGDRVEMFCPFVSTGTPNGTWDARYVLKDIRAYELLGRWMAA